MCCLAVSAADHVMPFTEALSGRTLPLSMPLKEFNADWRRITVQSTATPGGNVLVNVSGNPTAATSQNNINGAVTGTRSYLTKGSTLATEGRTYLIAYHLPATGLDLAALVQTAVTKSPSAAAALTPDSAIPLSLLDAASIGAIEDVRPFDMAAELADAQKSASILSELIKSQSSNSNSAPAAKPASKPAP